MEPVERKHIPKRLLLDTRMVHANLRDGIITIDEYQKHINDLSCKGKSAIPMDFIQNPIEDPEVVDPEVDDNTDGSEITGE
jgi:hypothetical protein